MKKTSIVFLVIIILGLGGTLYYFYNKDNGEKKSSNQLKNEKKEVIEELEQEKYIDDNPIKISFYVKNNGEKKLITEYTSNWDPEVIMGIFYAIATNDSSVSGNSYKNVWEEYWNQYSNIQDYKIGFNIKFTRNNGEITDQIILNPDHAYLMYPKLQFYLYDDINLIPGKPYYHVIQSAVTEKTKYTSIKLVGDTDTINIVSPIELTVFTYNGDEDFDLETGKYRGNSYYNILLYRK